MFLGGCCFLSSRLLAVRLSHPPEASSARARILAFELTEEIESVEVVLWRLPRRGSLFFWSEPEDEYMSAETMIE